MRQLKKRFAAPFLLACLFLAILAHANCACAAAAPRTVETTLPWLARMARFIVGSTMNIRPISRWTPDGTLKNLRKIEQGSTVIALDPKDAARHNMPPGRKDLYLLYENIPVPDIKIGSLPFDPSVLPFLGQRMLIAVSMMEPENYPYYQRRLAEFQSRLESTLEVGRSLIGESKLLDLTGSVSPWIQAASENAVRPPGDLWLAWIAGTRLNELTSALEEASRRGWTIVTDIWTPGQVKSRIPENHKKLTLDEPPADCDFFEHLHGIYLAIWDATTRK